jgi:carbon monoxide dehydrogenase subunit G
MNIEGTYTLLAPPERVWHGILHQDILLHTVPGIKQIEAIDAHTFAIALTLDQMPFVGNYTGKLTILEQQAPYHYLIAIEGEGEQERFHGDISIHLQDRETTTIVTYTGTIHPDAPTAQSTSITLARGAAKLLIQQFFTALDDQLHVNDRQTDSYATKIEQYDAYNTTGAIGVKSKNGVLLKKEASNDITFNVRPSAEQQGIFYKLAHLLRLGNGELEQEQIWAYRLRRATTLSGLLFLVWIGTRLPRRRNQG